MEEHGGSNIGSQDVPYGPVPSGVTADEAAAHPAAHWKSSADYWRAEAASAKLRFSMLPLVGVVGVDRLLGLRGIFSGAAPAGAGFGAGLGGDVPRPGLSPEEEARAWHARALYYETRARSYGRVVGMFSRPPLSWLDALWRSVYVKPRIDAAKALLDSMETPPERSATSAPDLISVITPTYNRAYTLHRAINSLLGQTYGNWELIVVDDGSDDGTDGLVGSYSDPRIRYIRIEHSGVSRARNVGLDTASGKYVSFLDSDNILDPKFLERMHAAISSSPPGVGLCHSDCTVYTDGYPAGKMTGEVTPARMFMEPMIDLGSIMCRREVFDGGLRFDESMDKWVDYELMLRMSGVWRFLHVPERLLHYFRLSDGITRAPYAVRDMTHNLERIRRTKLSILRVGYVIWDYPSLSQSFVHNEIKWLMDRGVRVTVFFREDPDKRAEMDYEVESVRVSSPGEVARLAAERGIHVLHSHFAYPAATKLTWPAAEEAGIPFTVMPHAVDIFAYVNDRRNKLRGMGRSRWNRAVFAYGDYHRDYFIERGVPEGRIVLKPQSIDPAMLAEPAKSPSGPARTVVFVGRFIEKKGIDDLLKAAARVADTPLRFHIYGYGPMADEVRKACLGLANVELHDGGLGYGEYKSVMRGADLFFMPCRRASNGDMDGLPTVFMEAAAMGVPVLTTGVSSIPVVIRDGETGFACPPGDTDCFEMRLREIAAMTPEELGRITSAARELAETRLHPDVVNNILVDTWVG